MIPQAALSVGRMTSSALKLSIPPSPEELELFGEAGAEGIIVQAERVAIGFARRRFRGTDLAYVDECITEAYFVVTEMIYEGLPEIKEKYPNKDERFTFFRMSVGYRLKAYWALRATQTESYLRAKGIEIRRHTLNESHLVKFYPEADEYVALEHAVRNERERRVVEFYTMGNDVELIASKLSLTERLVKKILTRIKKRLLR